MSYLASHRSHSRRRGRKIFGTSTTVRTPIVAASAVGAHRARLGPALPSARSPTSIAPANATAWPTTAAAVAIGAGHAAGASEQGEACDLPELSGHVTTEIRHHVRADRIPRRQCWTAQVLHHPTPYPSRKSVAGSEHHAGSGDQAPSRLSVAGSGARGAHSVRVRVVPESAMSRVP